MEGLAAASPRTRTTRPAKTTRSRDAPDPHVANRESLGSLAQICLRWPSHKGARTLAILATLAILPRAPSGPPLARRCRQIAICPYALPAHRSTGPAWPFRPSRGTEAPAPHDRGHRATSASRLEPGYWLQPGSFSSGRRRQTGSVNHRALTAENPYTRVSGHWFLVFCVPSTLNPQPFTLNPRPSTHPCLATLDYVRIRLKAQIDLFRFGAEPLG
jgi:hypothetical protein